VVIRNAVATEELRAWCAERLDYKVGMDAGWAAPF
jgi:hypothetical protein